MVKLFVYGTLKKNCKNHYLIESCEFISNASTVDKFALIKHKKGEFPCLIESPVFNIIGEMFLVEDKKILELDYFEGAPEYFFRKKISVLTDSGIDEAFVYVFKNKHIYGDVFSEWKE